MGSLYHNHKINVDSIIITCIALNRSIVVNFMLNSTHVYNLHPGATMALLQNSQSTKLYSGILIYCGVMHGVIYIRLLTLTAVFCCPESVEEQAAYNGLLFNLVVPFVLQGRQ